MATELTVKPFIDMKGPMGKILKSIRQDHCSEELEEWDNN